MLVGVMHACGHVQDALLCQHGCNAGTCIEALLQAVCRSTDDGNAADHNCGWNGVVAGLVQHNAAAFDNLNMPRSMQGKKGC